MAKTNRTIIIVEIILFDFLVLKKFMFFTSFLFLLERSLVAYANSYIIWNYHHICSLAAV